jgi:hypothetical protein
MLSFMVLSPVPWAKCIKALPVLTILCPSERHDQKKGRKHKLLTDWARQGVLQLCRWLPGREIIFVGDIVILFVYLGRTETAMGWADFNRRHTRRAGRCKRSNRREWGLISPCLQAPRRLGMPGISLANFYRAGHRSPSAIYNNQFVQRFNKHTSAQMNTRYTTIYPAPQPKGA